MAFYPTITGNAQSKFDLNNGFGDTSFDIYVFEEPDESQKAFMIFIIKNEASGSGNNLNIGSITGNSDFNSNGFVIDNLDEDSQTIPHLGLDGASNNKIKGNTVSGLLATNTGVTTAQTAANASGAVGFIGIKSSITDSDDGYENNASELNASSCTNIIPIYKTADISLNDLPPNSYCAFIVKYHPTAQISSAEFNPKLTITNSHSTQIINFLANAVNTLTIKLQTGSSVDMNPYIDTFATDANSGIYDDGSVIDLGYHPVGHIYDSTNKVFKIGDVSSVSTSYIYNPPSGYHNSASSGFLVRDGQYYYSAGLTSVRLRFNQSIRHRGNIHSYQATAANNLDSQPTMYPSGAPIYKNFSLRDPDESFVHVNYRSTHYNPGSANPDLYEDYRHVTPAQVGFRVQYSIGKILNSDYPAETADGSNNQFFVYGIQSGFYNKLSMSEEQIDVHKKSTGSSGDSALFRDRYFNIGVNPSASEGPHLESSSGTLFRKGNINLGVTLRYNNFNGSTESDYTLPALDFSASGVNSLNLYSQMQEGNALPVAYGSESSWDIYGAGVTTSTASQTWSEFNNGADGTHLQLKYNLTLDSLSKNSLYEGYTTLYNKIGWLPRKYGLIEAVYRPGSIGASAAIYNMWQKGLGFHNVPHDDDDHGVKYRLGFNLIPSTLELVGTDETLDTWGQDFEWSCRLFDDQDVDDSYISNVTKIPVSTWYTHNSASESSADVKNKLYSNNSDIINEEGDWYGAAGLGVNQPKCWVSGNTSRRYTEGSGTGYYIKHNPVIKYIKTGSSSFYEESSVANFYFKLEDATYDSSVSKYRSAGRLFFKNTGDYPIYIQNVSIGHGNLPIDGSGNSYMSQGKLKMLFPEENATVKPDETNSHDPIWNVSYANSSGWDGIHEFSNSDYNLKIPSDVSGNPDGFTHYYTNQTVSSNANDTQVKLIKTMWDTPNLFSSQANSSNELKYNWVNVSFELDPTNNSSYDQGDYYAQILVSYYVGDRYNEQLDVDTSGSVATSELLLSSASNYQTRLNVSKYLVKVSVSSVGTITITDAESDSISGDIIIPSLVVG